MRFAWLFPIALFATACQQDCPYSVDSLQVVQSDIVYAPSTLRVSDFLALECVRAVPPDEAGTGTYAECADASAGPATAQQRTALSAAIELGSSSDAGQLSGAIGCDAAGETAPCMTLSLVDPRFFDPTLGVGGGDGFESRIDVHMPGPGTYALADLHAQYCEFQAGATAPPSCTPLDGTMAVSPGPGGTVVYDIGIDAGATAGSTTGAVSGSLRVEKVTTTYKNGCGGGGPSGVFSP